MMPHKRRSLTIYPWIRLFFILVFSYTGGVVAQQTIEKETLKWKDPSRDNRLVKAALFYPLNEPSNQQLSTPGSYPFIIFSHGFTMHYKAYKNIWEELVPKGYIIAFLRTETGFSPSHKDYAQDIAFIAQQFSQKEHKARAIWNGKIIAMGHSMGGGGSARALDLWDGFDGYIALNPAADSTAFRAAENFNAPALIFSGTADRITPTQEDHMPLYEAFASDCKSIVLIEGGGHCRFNEWNFYCEFGEFAAQSKAEVSRKEQQKLLYTYLIPWLESHFKSPQLNSLPDVFSQNQEKVRLKSSCKGD